MAGQLPEGEAAERRPGVAARLGERQTGLRPRGLTLCITYEHFVIILTILSYEKTGIVTLLLMFSAVTSVSARSKVLRSGLRVKR